MRVTLTNEQRLTFERAAYRVYNAVAGDCWGERTPSKAEFFSVVVDLMDGCHATLSASDVDLFRSLSTAEQKRIIFSVGP